LTDISAPGQTGSQDVSVNVYIYLKYRVFILLL
jgi:hypothetical protein